MNGPVNPANPSNPAPAPGPDPAPAATPQAPAAAPTPPQIIIQQQAPPRRRLLSWLAWIGLAVCGYMLFSQWSARSEYYDVTEGIREKYHSGNKTASDKVAIISVRGVILEGDGFVKRQIDRVRQDDQVKAIVVRVDSPGGTVTGSDYIYHHLKKLHKQRGIPLVVSMGSLAASGGYYVAMAVGDEQNSIFAEPTTTTGSIGVIVPHYDLSGLLQKFEVRNDSIVSHPRKQLLSTTRPMSAEDRQIIQAYVDESFERFKEIVKAGRPALKRSNKGQELIDAQTGRDLATGEVFTATVAKQLGLVDRIGFIEDAIERAIELAQLDKGRVRVVQYQRPPTLMGWVGMAEAPQPGLSLATLLELNTPRAYYLATSLPILSSSRRH